MTVIDGDHQVEILTFEDEDGRWALRHSASHILAQAVKTSLWRQKCKTCNWSCN